MFDEREKRREREALLVRCKYLLENVLTFKCWPLFYAGGVPELHPRAGHEEFRSSAALRHSRLQTNVS